MSNSHSFALATAFSTQPFGGNPAAVIFLDLNTPADILGNIARNFNQPMSAFVSPTHLSSDDGKTARFAIRWFTSSGKEIPLCGHATLCTAKVIFTTPNLVHHTVEILEFESLTGGILTARRLDQGWIELACPAGIPEELSSVEKAKVTPHINAAFGRNVKINHVASGGKGFEYYVLVELAEEEDLKSCIIDASALRDNGYIVNVFTTASSSGKELFLSRMFAPGLVPGDEDPVCGSAHCIMGPYWSRKRQIPSGQEINATQVSSRGGQVRLIWEEDKAVVHLRGQVTTLGVGKLQLDGSHD